MIKDRHSHNIRRARHIIIAMLAFIALPLILPASLTGQKPDPKATTLLPGTLPEIKPQIPSANRNTSQKVFLERADCLTRAERDDYMVVMGNVEFSHGAMLMFCDSAHFYPDTESLNAFGNVRMRQGDTLFVYADELNYIGDREIAYLYGTDAKPVRMINRDVTLTTPTFIYDMLNEYGYYNEGGQLTDKQNRLDSDEGEYIPSTKEANFYTNVVMTSLSKTDTMHIWTDTLFYNTDSHVAQLVSPSTIVNKDATIETTNGTYNTETAIANLFNRSKVVASTGTTLVGDTLFYDRETGFGEAFGNMEINDTAHSVIFTGNYGYYNELVDSAFATGRALAKEYSQGDTLYLHARYLYSFTRIDSTHIEADTIAGIEEGTQIDTTYVMVAHPRVRFYRSDVQGLCDSMRFEQRDTTLSMYYHPVLWSGERQIFGNVIMLHLNDSTVDRANLPDFGFSAEQVEDKYFNQLSGKEMIAYFTDGEMTQLDVNGNVQAIMLPQENDSTYNKIVNVESSFMTATFEKQQIQKMKMWPETNGTVTPLYLAKKTLYYLPQFKWYTPMRPNAPDEVFIIPPEMDELMSDVPPTTFIPPRRVNLLGEPETYDGDSDTDADTGDEAIASDEAEAEAEDVKAEAPSTIP